MENSIPYSIVNTPPDIIYETAKKKFGVDFDKGIVFTVGNTIHTKEDLPADVLAHELVHVRQQTDLGVDTWWTRYFIDIGFRFTQELEAYQEQYRWVLRNIPDPNHRIKYLLHYARCLSGEMYGKLTTMENAIKLIKNNG